MNSPLKVSFVKSSSKLKECPQTSIPEFAFIGRSNVGKSSLINALCEQKKLAKTSNKPGKTKLINHFLVNEQWMLVDLPGYGYAGSSKDDRAKWEKMVKHYLRSRESLHTLFVLIDIRHPLQKIDEEFMTWTGENEIPIVVIYTKEDKLRSNEVAKRRKAVLKDLKNVWEPLPHYIFTSAVTGLGREEILKCVEGGSLKNEV